MSDGLKNLNFCCDMQMLGSESGINSMNPWTLPVFCQQVRLLVVVYWCWECFLAHIGHLNINRILFETQAYLSIVTNHIHPFKATIFNPTYSTMATFSMIMDHVKKQKSFPTGCVNIAVSSLYYNGLHNHQS